MPREERSEFQRVRQLPVSEIMIGQVGGGEVWTARNISFEKECEMMLSGSILQPLIKMFFLCVLAMLFPFLALCGLFVTQASPFVDPLPSALSK